MECKKSKKMLKVERRIGKPLEQAMPEAYEKWGTIRAAASELDIPTATFRWWMANLGMATIAINTLYPHPLPIKIILSIWLSKNIYLLQRDC